MPICLNCQNEFKKEHKFCQQCGQKTKLSELRFFTILKDFFKNLFNIESKIWNTFKAIWIPGKLATAFVEGRRKKYYHPLRFFLVVLFAFFTVVVMETREGISQIDELKEREQKNIWNDDMTLAFDSLVKAQKVEFDSLLPFRAKLLNLNTKDSLVDFNLQDSILNEILQDSNLTQLDTSILDLQEKDWNSDGNGSVISTDNNSMRFGNIEGKDFYRLSKEELLKKHGDGKWWKEKLLVQSQKFMNDISSSVSFFIGNGTWMIIVTILLMALLFKLLYVRHNYFYVEHFIFHTYGHTRILLITLIVILLSRLISLGGIIQLFLFFAAWIYLFLGMKKYYKQSFFKTLIKFGIVSISYVFVISLCMLLVLAISFVFL